MRQRLGSLNWVVLAALSTGLAADWPHLRGPNYDGVSEESGLASSWPEAGPPRLWQRELGQGHSAFVIAQGKAYVQRQTIGGQYLLCLNPDTGETIWETRYDWAWQPKGAYPGPYASPTFYNGRVFYSSPTGLLGCMDADSGALLWSTNVREKFDGKGFDFGYAATPLVEDGRVIVPVGGAEASMVALDVDDGRVIWTSGSDSASYCPAFPISFKGRRCIVGYLQNALVVVDAKTGALLHRQTLSSGYDEHSAWPLYKEPHLLLSGPFRAGAFRLQLENATNDTLLARTNWLSKELSNDIVSSVLYQGHVYGFDLKQAQASKHRASRGTFRCIDWSTGKATWSTEHVGHAAVLAADKRLFLLTDTGALILAAADPAEYRELGRVQLFDDEICWAPPTLSNGRLFVRSPSKAVCLYVGNSDKITKQEAITSGGRRSGGFDLSWFLGPEREFPNDAFSFEEMRLWFGASLLLVFGGAAVIASLSLLAKPLAISPIFWASAFVLGVVGTGALGGLWNRCIFTWPAAVYAATHATALVCASAERMPSSTRLRWLSRFFVLGLLLVCYGYYELCRAAGMFVGWAFLIGLLPAFPFIFLAVRATTNKRPAIIVPPLTIAAFSVFFWSCYGFLLWRDPG